MKENPKQSMGNYLIDRSPTVSDRYSDWIHDRIEQKKEIPPLISTELLRLLPGQQSEPDVSLRHYGENDGKRDKK